MPSGHGHGQLYVYYLFFLISRLHHDVHETGVIVDDLEYLKEVEGRITFKNFSEFYCEGAS
jgi:hypothetical protein